MVKSTIKGLVILLLGTLISGCPGRVLDSATKRVAEGLSRGILNQNDVATVRDGLPAYLLIIDGLIESSPQNADLLLAGAKLYSSYASSFTDDIDRSQRLSNKGLGYGKRMLCIRLPDLCLNMDEPFEVFKEEIDDLTLEEVPVAYGFTTAWAAWIQAHSDDWNAIAQVPKITALLERIVELDEDYDQGNTYLYLGVLATQLPPSLGGKPEQGRKYFERAITISDGHNLLAKVLFAKQYARLVFNRPLHDRLLKEVLEQNPESQGLTLSNTLAQHQARRLLESGNEYF